MIMSEKKIATNLGWDISTTATAAGVRSANREEGFASVPVKGAIEWKGQPAFDLDQLPGQMLEVLEILQGQGWEFSPVEAGTEKRTSCAVRQHDMVLAGDNFSPLMPALSWQCNVAEEQVCKLNAMEEVRQEVGVVEPRFILPKLCWAIETWGALNQQIKTVMTTGDWILARLTGVGSLSTSDALSNGLLNQQTRELACAAMRMAGINYGWFPPVVRSGHVVGGINSGLAYGDWEKIARMLEGWEGVAGLGDNHATGVGCGLAKRDTVVVSAGSSGTINRMCLPGDQLAGCASCFEYYNERLLLLMLADCAVWYERFVETLNTNKSYEQLNKEAWRATVSYLRRVGHTDGEGEVYPDQWQITTSLPTKVASTQYSIVVELLLLVKQMLAEVKGKENWIQKFVLTGGLSQSRFFQQVFEAGISLLDEKATVLRSARTGPLAYQTAAYGAVLNSMLPGCQHDLRLLVEQNCLLEKIRACDDTAWNFGIAKHLRRDLGVG